MPGPATWITPAASPRRPPPVDPRPPQAQAVARDLPPHPRRKLRSVERPAARHLRAHRHALRERRHDASPDAGGLCRARRIARPAVAGNPRSLQTGQGQEINIPSAYFHAHSLLWVLPSASISNSNTPATVFRDAHLAYVVL